MFIILRKYTGLESEIKTNVENLGTESYDTVYFNKYFYTKAPHSDT
jgi:hypothetical protein